MRNTLHLLKTEDYLLMHPLLQHTLSRHLRLFAQKAEGFDMGRFVTEMLTYVQEQPRTGVELRAKMEEFFPGMGQQQIADAVRTHLALIQPPPAGTWNFTGRPTHTEALAWVGRPWASGEEGLPQLILRYLAAFGPARAQDIQKWSGISKLQPVLETLRPKLLTFRDEQGKELFDLPHAPRPEADTPAPVRFLAAFDNLLLSYIERERMIAEAYVPLVFTNNGFEMATILVDGFVRGLWKIERQSTATTLVIKVFESLSPSDQNALSEEGEQLMHWINGNTMPYNIQLITSQ